MSNDNGGPENKSKGEREVPIVEEDFAKLLQKFKIKPELAANIAENISHTGGGTVFEEPPLLTKRLSAWSGEIAPAKRKLIIEQWFAEKGIEVSPEIIKTAGLSTEEIKKAEKEKEEGGKVLYRYDQESNTVVMSKPGEGGGTLAQAQKLKVLADESTAGGKESPFIMDNQGQLIPNPKAKLGGIEILALEVIKKSQAAGETVDPIQAIVDSAQKMQVFREALGVPGAGGAGSVTDTIELVTKLKALSGEEGGSKELKEEISSMRQTISDMKDEAHKEQIAAQSRQIESLGHKVTELTEAINDPSRRPGAKTEMDIIGEIVHSGMEEIRGVRTDIKGFVSGQGLPQLKTPADREKRKERYRQQISTDREVEELGTRLFVTQS